MKRFLVNKDYIVKLENSNNGFICAETVSCEDYVLYITKYCEMDAGTILRNVINIDGYIPNSIYFKLRSKLINAVARIKDDGALIVSNVYSTSGITCDKEGDHKPTIKQSCETCRYKKLKWNSKECFNCKSNSNYVSHYILTPGVAKVIVNGPATIIFWTDGTKSIVKCQDDEEFDLEKGIALCFVRKALGNENKYHKHIRKAVKMAEDYIEEHTIDTESKKVDIGQATDVFAAEANRVIKSLFKEKDNE